MMDLKIVGAGATVDETGLPLIRDDRDINTQPPSDLDLTWRDAVFSGRHWLLGPIWLTLSSVGTSSIRLSSVSSDQDHSSRPDRKASSTGHWKFRAGT